ncbi:hypothetical protein CDAR_556901 [Caerostris darwini]|uniref:Uncharacterized protein n=1 Tax=Caerostris darwini TaxID=1538125 RepID=A0AAV4QGC1_9ARAC|nr:hypothetical protein CDAR_556901 [Caerostris darwini]
MRMACPMGHRQRSTYIPPSSYRYCFRVFSLAAVEAIQLATGTCLSSWGSITNCTFMYRYWMEKALYSFEKKNVCDGPSLPKGGITGMTREREGRFLRKLFYYATCSTSENAEAVDVAHPYLGPWVYWIEEFFTFE